nr:hypothetical protein GCM10017611_86040 [Rhodococcus wratislaviensis]
MVLLVVGIAAIGLIGAVYVNYGNTPVQPGPKMLNRLAAQVEAPDPGSDVAAPVEPAPGPEVPPESVSDPPAPAPVPVPAAAPAPPVPAPPVEAAPEPPPQGPVQEG